MDRPADLPPVEASRLSAKQICDELERRGRTQTGFLGEDILALQAIFNAEHAEECAERQRRFELDQAAAIAAEEARQRQRCAAKNSKQTSY